MEKKAIKKKPLKNYTITAISIKGDNLKKLCSLGIVKASNKKEALEKAKKGNLRKYKSFVAKQL